MSNHITPGTLVKRILNEKELTSHQARTMSRNYSPDKEETCRSMTVRFNSGSFINIGPFMTGYLELLLELAEGEDRRMLQERIVEVVFRRIRLGKIMNVVNASRKQLGKPVIFPVGMYKLYLNKSQKKELPRYRVPASTEKKMLGIISKIDRKKYLETHKKLSDTKYTMIVRNSIHRPGIIDSDVFNSFAVHLGKRDIERLAKISIFKAFELEEIKEVSNFLEIVGVNLKRMFITAITE